MTKYIGIGELLCEECPIDRGHGQNARERLEGRDMVSFATEPFVKLRVHKHERILEIDDMAFIHQFKEASKQSADHDVRLGTQTFTEVKRESPDSDPSRPRGILTSKFGSDEGLGTATMTKAREEQDSDSKILGAAIIDSH